jgi:hypothetical protein
MINAQARMVDGRMQTPTLFGPDGWHGWKAGPYRQGAFEIWYATQDPQDRAAAGSDPWISFLEGANSSYPETALEADLARLARRDAAQRADHTTPDTRLADWTLDFNPASADLGATDHGQAAYCAAHRNADSPPQGRHLHCRLRYFDPARRRAGLPADVAALVHSLGDTATQVTLVNTGTSPRV